MKEELEYQNAAARHPVLGTGEMILWKGKPKKSAFICARSLTMLPIAVIWLLFDLNIIIGLLSGSQSLFMLPFFTLHLMPVWIWLASMVTSFRRWKNTMYYVTNRRIIMQGGFFAVNETSLYYKDIRDTRVRIGLFEKLFHTGTICFNAGVYTGHGRNQMNSGFIKGNMLEHLENPYDVYNRVQRTVLDMQADMEFPNALRPDVNPGYQTQYRPK